MLEREKQILVCLLYVLGMVAVFFGFKYFTKIFNPKLTALLAFSFLYLFIIPAFRAKYYQFYSLNNLNGLRCFIPIFNEISMFTATQSILYIISLFLTVIPAVLFFVNPADMPIIDGDVLVFSWGTGCLVAFIFALTFHCVVKGVAWIELCHDINRQISKNDNTPKESDRYHFIDSCFIILQYFFLCAPLFRAISICFQYSRLKGLADFRHARFNTKNKMKGGKFHE